MTTSKTRGLLAFIVLASVLSGCGVKSTQGENPGSAINQPPPTVSPAPTDAVDLKETDAIIYLSDADLLEMVEHPVKLTYSTEEELLKAAFAELQQTVDENALSLWEKIELKSIKLEEGQATLDIRVPDEARLGAPGELLVVETLLQTWFQFDFVDAIDIQVDGEAVESLMGHVELEHPVTKESYLRGE